MTSGVDLRAPLSELQAKRADIAETLASIDASIQLLLDLDRHLVDQGINTELQLTERAGEPARTTASEPVSPPAPATTDAPARRRYSDEEKAEAVRMADEMGSDSAAARELGMHAVSIGTWRRDGHGKRPARTTGTTSGTHPSAREVNVERAPAAGPSLRCPSCREAFPIDGAADNPIAKAQAWSKHYRESPSCEETNRRRATST